MPGLSRIRVHGCGQRQRIPTPDLHRLLSVNGRVEQAAPVAVRPLAARNLDAGGNPMSVAGIVSVTGVSHGRSFRHAVSINSPADRRSSTSSEAAVAIALLAAISSFACRSDSAAPAMLSHRPLMANFRCAIQSRRTMNDRESARDPGGQARYRARHASCPRAARGAGPRSSPARAVLRRPDRGTSAVAEHLAVALPAESAIGWTAPQGSPGQARWLASTVPRPVSAAGEWRRPAPWASSAPPLRW